MKDSMNIHTPFGSKVRYSFPKNGMPHDKKRLNELGFVVGNIYIVDWIQVNAFSTEVHLVGFKGSFNSVNFSNVGA